MPYLNVTQVESDLAAAANRPFMNRFALPENSREGRQCHAVKIADGGGGGRPGVYFLGGLHAREWGSSDILVNFVQQLRQAYDAHTTLTFGNKTFSAQNIATIVQTLDIFVFPQANPDGRRYSMLTDADWRKNRRMAAPNSALQCGVDLNRNFDFMWSFDTYFHPSVRPASTANPGDYETYRGDVAFSEPEARNAKWMLDNHPNIAYLVDLHSYGQQILYAWGDDVDQTTDNTMNFGNATYNHRRGRGLPNEYGEYIPNADRTAAVALANALRTGIAACRGTAYTVAQSFNLYPTSGTSDDYAYSRHIVNGALPRVLAYTLEWGMEFQPDYDQEMVHIIPEVTCGLLAFCLQVANG